MTEIISKTYPWHQNFFRRYKSQIIFASKFIIAAGLLLFLIFAVDFNSIIVALKNADFVLVAAAFTLTALNIYLQYLKWNITCSYILNDGSKKKAAYSLFYGFSAGAFTPVRIGEYFGRALLYKDKSILQVTVATLIDKFFPLLVLSFFGSLASILFIHVYYNASFYLTAALTMVVFVLFYFFIMLILHRKFWNNIVFDRLKNSKHLKKIFERLKVLKHLDAAYSVKMFSISFAFFITYLFQYALLAAAFSLHFKMIDYLWAGILVMFSKSFIPPVSIGELGIREGASVFFIKYFGEQGSVGFNASIFLFLINILIPSFIGMLLLLKKKDD